MSLITNLANQFQVPESGLKLLLTVYSGYLFGTFHRRFLFAKSAVVQQAFFTVVGALLIYWNYSSGIVHSLACIISEWLILKIFGTGQMFIGVSFMFQLTYLVMGYVFSATEGYDIDWTMAHCILTLRLIGLSFDIYDGHRDQNKVTAEQKTLSISDSPSLLEMFGFCYYFGGFNVGPQFPLRRFREMVDGELTDDPGNRPRSVYPAFRRCASGTLVLLIQLVLDMNLPQSTLLEPGFLETGFLNIAGTVCIRGHLLLLQYVAIWMINEGVCILSGLGYYKKDGKDKWDAVRNVRLGKFIFSKSFQDMIESFNINTNQWVLRYVFKRLRFLGNKKISHITTLMFLAIWHGYHEGYFTCFLYEFLVMSVERPVREELSQSNIVQTLKSSKLTSWIPSLIGWLYLRMLFGYCLLDFSLRKWKYYAPIYKKIYYYGHVFYIVLWMLLQIYVMLFKKTSKKEKPLKKVD